MPGRLARELEADHVRRTQLRRRRRQPERLRACGELVRPPAERRRDARDRPLQDLLDRRERHRRELEVRALADVEAPRARQVLVAVVDERREVVGAGAQEPVRSAPSD